MKIDQQWVTIGILVVIVILLLFRKTSRAAANEEYTSPTAIICPTGFTRASSLTDNTPSGSLCINGKQNRAAISVTCPSGWQQNKGSTRGKMCKRAVVQAPPPPPPKPLTISIPPPPTMTPEQSAQARAAYLAAGGV